MFKTPRRRLWHTRVEGQIRDAMIAHPEWFTEFTHTHKKQVLTSLAKRIVGEILADDVDFVR